MKRQSFQTPQRDQWGQISESVQALPTESCVEHFFRDQIKSYSIVIKIIKSDFFNLVISISQEGAGVTLRIDDHPQQLSPVVYQLMTTISIILLLILYINNIILPIIIPGIITKN